MVFRLALDSNGNLTWTVLHAFTNGLDGGNPAGIVLDGGDNIYGFTSDGGTNGYGTFFSLKASDSGKWEERVLYNFTDIRANPLPNGPSTDGAGNFFGESYEWGPPDGYGYVFELSLSSRGVWTYRVIYTFSGGLDGGTPLGQLTLDRAGNLYGTAGLGGELDRGVVFRLTPISTGGAWSESVLYDFAGAGDGYMPASGVVFDGAGNIYGTTANDGASPGCSPSGGCATVFELKPTAAGEWIGSVLYSFGGTGPLDGLSPSGLTFDEDGNMFGVTYQGGSGGSCYNGCGMVFELSPNGAGQWITRIVHNFTDAPKGYNPAGNVVTLPDGRIFGTTSLGGTASGLNGTIFELSPR